MNLTQFIGVLIWITLLVIGVMVVYVFQVLIEEIRKINENKRNDTKIF
tara:strand:- start:7769 stop:7912 length:144 start_codon:yes stop_codon:yes gene_type:complete